MAAWQRTFASTVIQNVLPASNVETVVAQLAITDATADSVVLIEGWAKITTGTSTTFIVPRIRRAALAGTLVGDQTPITIIGAVGSTGEYGIKATDQPGEVASLLYVLTIVQTAAAAAGTLVATMLKAVC